MLDPNCEPNDSCVSLHAIIFCTASPIVLCTSLVTPDRTEDSGINVGKCQHNTMWLHETRYKIMGMCFIAAMICYAARFSLSVAIIAMSTEYRWSKASQGWLLSAFFYGYITSGYVGGLLATRYGGFHVLNAAVCMWSLFTYLTPAAARFSLSALMLCRFCLGISQGATFPSMYALVAQWSVSEEKTRSIAGVTTGSSVGACLTIALAPLVMEHMGWDVVFLGTGYLGFAWCLIWMTLMNPTSSDVAKPPAPSSPHLQPPISTSDPFQDFARAWANNKMSASIAISIGSCASGGSSESAEMYHQGKCPSHESKGAEVEVEREVPGTGGAAPSRAFTLNAAFTSPPVIALMVGHFAHNWSLYTLLSWLPTYVSEQLGVTASHVGLVFFPYLVMSIMALTGGWITDALVSRGHQLLFTRKLMAVIGMIGPALALAVFGMINNLAGSMVVLCVIMGLSSLNQSGILANHLDIAPTVAGQVQGITNSVATIPGMMAVAITGQILHHFNSWMAVFLVCSAIQVVGVLPFLFFGTTNVVLH